MLERTPYGMIKQGLRDLGAPASLSVRRGHSFFDVRLWDQAIRVVAEAFPAQEERLGPALQKELGVFGAYVVQGLLDAAYKIPTVVKVGSETWDASVAVKLVQGNLCITVESIESFITNEWGRTFDRDGGTNSYGHNVREVARELTKLVLFELSPTPWSRYDRGQSEYLVRLESLRRGRIAPREEYDRRNAPESPKPKAESPKPKPQTLDLSRKTPPTC